MTMHLIESTIVLAVALVVIRIPRLTSATRHAIVYAALLKFAIPSSLFTMLIERLGMTPSGATIALVHRADRALAIAAPAQSLWPLLLRDAWIVIAIALALRAFALSRHVTTLAFRETSSPSARELLALERARALSGARGTIDLVRSPFAAAPAAIGRSTIVLPSDCCEDLDDAELASILAHECAHIARRDNFLGVIETLIGCAFWFHPLIWIARRDLALRREEACDEIAARDAATPYLDALKKLGRAAIVPHVASVACMATSHLHERINRIMSLSPQRRFLPHRAVAAIAVVLIAAFTIAAGAAHAGKPAQKYTGDPITMSLKDADIHDVMNSFSQLASLKIVFDVETTAKVTIDVKDMPWDEAFDRIVADAGLNWVQHKDGTTHITNK